MSKGIALPDGLAQDLNAKKQRTAMLKGLRIQFAGDVFAHLVATSYHASLAAGIHKQQRKADVYGNGEADPDKEPEGISFSIDLVQPATLAVRAADNLLLFLGMIDPQAVREAADVQDQMIATLMSQGQPQMTPRRRATESS